MRLKTCGFYVVSRSTLFETFLHRKFVKDKKLSEVFEAIRERPIIYFGKMDSERATCFLHGFYCGFGAASEINLNVVEARNKILKTRGWKVPSVYLEKEMERKGMSDEEIINELLEIEIETWRLVEQQSDAE